MRQPKLERYAPKNGLLVPARFIQSMQAPVHETTQAETPKEPVAETRWEPETALPKGERMVPVFPAKELDCLKPKLSKEKSNLLHDAVLQACRDEGYREVPEWTGLADRIAKFRADFQNFCDAIDYLEIELALAAALPVEEFRVPPILLHGAPGIGKTFMCSRLAETLGVSFEKVTAGGVQGPFVLVGTSSHWSNTHPGRVFELLARDSQAVAVLLIDEVDKLPHDDRHPFVPALLELLEGESARTFRDESVGVAFDASRLIVVMTANDVGKIPAPLRSRAQEFEIETPGAAQRVAIVERMVKHYQDKTGKPIALDKAQCARLAEDDSIDLRELQRIVRRSFGRALSNGLDQLEFDIPEAAARQRLGFI